MTHSLRMRGPRLILAALVLSGFSVAAGCTDDSTDSTVDPDPTPNKPTRDAGSSNNTTDEDSSTSANDAGSDAKQNADACADGGCAPPTGCAAYAEAAFCDDFDKADALMPNKTKWDFIERPEQPVVTLSTVRAVSAPNSLLSEVIAGAPGAKFAKTVTKAGFTEAKWSYDIYFDDVGTENGFFLDDFQFTDDGGADRFGFRLVLNVAAGEISAFKVEHNAPAVGEGDTASPPFPAGTIMRGKWHHIEQTVKFTFATGDAGSGNRVTYTLNVDKAATPVWKQEYEKSLTREQAAFARIAGMPFIFNIGQSAGAKIHWDNHVLELK